MHADIEYYTYSCFKDSPYSSVQHQVSKSNYCFSDISTLQVRIHYQTQFFYITWLFGSASLVLLILQNSCNYNTKKYIIHQTQIYFQLSVIVGKKSNCVKSCQICLFYRRFKFATSCHPQCVCTQFYNKTHFTDSEPKFIFIKSQRIDRVSMFPRHIFSGKFRREFRT